MVLSGLLPLINGASFLLHSYTLSLLSGSMEAPDGVLHFPLCVLSDSNTRVSQIAIDQNWLFRTRGLHGSPVTGLHAQL